MSARVKPRQQERAGGSGWKTHGAVASESSLGFVSEALTSLCSCRVSGAAIRDG